MACLVGFMQVVGKASCATSMSPDNRRSTVSKSLTILAWSFASTLVAQQSNHWSYQPIVAVDVSRLEPAPTSQSSWAASPIDRLVLQAMRTHGLQPSPPADQATWLRRVTLDLTGLPPTIAELDAFLANPASSAREQVVERLLLSDAYAERWAA